MRQGQKEKTTGGPEETNHVWFCTRQKSGGKRRSKKGKPQNSQQGQGGKDKPTTSAPRKRQQEPKTSIDDETHQGGRGSTKQNPTRGNEKTVSSEMMLRKDGTDRRAG